MKTQGSSFYCTIGGFTLDDTVLPTGEVRWAAPGGNALYSAVGARLWGVEVGIAALVGSDYPQSHLDRLAAVGFDLSGVRRVDHPGFHVWILHEGGNRRQIVYRLDSGRNEDLDPQAEGLPSHYLAARGMHICPIRSDSQMGLMLSLLQRQVPLFLDLIVIPSQIESDWSQHRELWPQLRAFLPSLEEVRAIWGQHSLAELVAQVKAACATFFAIKMGSWGCVVGDAVGGALYHIPAYPATAVDTTGAGDAFCGAFMVGLQETGSVLEAALFGSVSASLVIEGFGALHALDIPAEVMHQRLEYLRPRVRPLEEAGLLSLDPVE